MDTHSMLRHVFLFGAFLLVACGDDPTGPEEEGALCETPLCNRAALDALGLNPFYQKYLDADGIPIISSEKVVDEALLEAKGIVDGMLAFRPDEPAESSGIKSADATVLTGEGYFHQIIVMPDGTNDVTIKICDGNGSCPANSEILPIFTFAGDGGPQASPPVWIPVNTGIYVDITIAAGSVAETP